MGHERGVLALPLWLAACATTATVDWQGFDVLSAPACPPHRAVGGIPVSEAQYETVLGWGEKFFREGSYGGERSVTDVMGVLGGTVDVPCDAGPDCREPLAVLDVYVQAVDDLDGVRGNLFEGNGAGRTSNLVFRFPPGTTLYDLPVPEEVHTGLDVEAGAFLPIGLHPVPTEDEGAQLFEPSAWGAGPGAPEGRFRLRLTCAACHYSLDVDNDGVVDLDSSVRGQLTPGSPYRPEDAWGVGNQDLHFGWLFGLSANPLMGALVLGGDIGSEAPHKGADATAFMAWLAGSYTDPQKKHVEDRGRVPGYFREDVDGATREVLRGMLLQPRGYADVNSDAAFNTMQLPPLYTRHLWPANVNGAIFDPVDRNNTVWSGALDFTGLIGLCADRGGRTKVPGEASFQHVGAVPCDDFADLMLAKAPVDDEARAALKADILGHSDGIPGMLGPDGVVLVPGAGTMLDDPALLARAEARGIVREYGDYGRAGEMRRGSLALLGYRLALPPEEDAALGMAELARDIGLQPDEMVAHSLNVMMDWLDPPANETALLAASAGLVARGREVFEAEGCADCHTGPFFTDNRVIRLSDDDEQLFGAPRVPSTTGWREPMRGQPETIGTQEERATTTRKIRRFASAPYDPQTGLPAAKATPIGNLARVQTIGYRTAPLRHVWASAPYLHDGGVGVAVTRPVGTDLAAHLAAVDGPEVVHGMGQILAAHEANPTPGLRPDAALSLQALVLESERARVIAKNAEDVVAVLGTSVYQPDDQPSHVSMVDLGVSGEGHAFYVDDRPGGPDVTALVAFLLALDDCPGDLPGRDGDACPETYAVPADQGLAACPQTPGLYADLSEWYR
ncbi:MAG: hypothetical protein EP330_30185 [Deltaproteobacteria bacterium]|nr:MAG: hypothetical protein EP330_30185 [Deltaproteobacteria bacterium]